MTLDTPQSIAFNGTVALSSLICLAPVVAVILLALWRGPARWPQTFRALWAQVPQDAQKWTLAILTTPLTWLLVGIVLGSAFINPLARWLRLLIG